MKIISINENWMVRQPAEVGFLKKPGEALIVNLPHDAVINSLRDSSLEDGAQRAFFPTGVWEYIKELEIPKEYTEKHVELRFEGAFTRAMVYINGFFAGQRPYGYSEFYIDTDKFLNYGEKNEIKVVVRTTNDARWYAGAGLQRPVSMLVSNLTHFSAKGVKVSTSNISNEQAVIIVENIIQSNELLPTQTLRVVTEIYDENNKIISIDNSPITVFRSESVNVHQRMYINNPCLWGEDSPHLYTCHVKLMRNDEIIDETTDTFGIRQLSLDNEQGLCVNGKQVKLRGACIHRDNGLLGAVSIPAAEMRRIKKLKEAGFNAIRSAHYPASRALLAACDFLGMFVMEESFDVWTNPKNNFDYSLDFNEWWERDIEAMIDKDYNRPSVIIYSIGNEIMETGNPHGATRGRKIIEKIRSLDVSRFTLNSINGMFSVMDRLKDQMMKKAEEMSQKDINQAMTDVGERVKQVMRMELIGDATEEAFSYVDIAGYNYMDGRYEMDKELFPNRIICGSETYPSNIDKSWQLVRDYNHVIGDFTWTGWDYLGEIGIGRVVYDAPGNVRLEHKGDYPWITAWCGDLDITGFRRPISYYREIVFNIRKEPYIAVFRPEHYGKDARLMHWSWSDTVSGWSWGGYEGKPIKVEVYSDADEVELLLNGNNLGRMPTGESNRFKAIFDTIYQPGELIAIAYSSGVETGRYKLQSTERDIVLNIEQETNCSNENELIYINISLTDKNNNPCHNFDRQVEVTVVGAAGLVALGSAKPDNTEGYFKNNHRTFDGRLLAILRPKGSGAASIKVAAEGCCTVEQVLNI